MNSARPDGGTASWWCSASVQLAYNKLNNQADFEDMEVLRTYDFTPNRAVVFVKTFNSWHSVRPMRGGSSKTMRRTPTINIESRG